ncbi:MAG: thiamine pyrophosphate-binding protein [Arcobacter sp.]|uniref:thiamine pyrophosphate-dependent enzyme n=1 Tax=uncultured Arcobacter sp. TaxID=165434 RepID=UPI000CC4E8F0|nr:thiamine pyrophosphate-dependent enzyme [uncultured Arcobacter sp.]PLY08730.1 MAG: thiamine pyrophosphate-binding protein [Arcobacter sp.]
MPLDTKVFVNRLIKEHYTHLCVVPCSFAKYVINEAINNPNIEYVPCASEAVACSIAAGLKMSDKKPIVIVQSSGVTNMGSCITSLLKPYGVTFPILTSWRTYKEGDSEIQHQHLATQLPSLIEAYGYEHTILDNENLNNAISQVNSCDNTNTICILKKDSFTKVALDEKHIIDLSKYIPRSKYLINLNEKFKDTQTLFIGTTGNTAREMYSFMPDTNNFYMAGNMGGALSLGLGSSMAGKKVFVCGGDAEFVMHMGGLTTAGRYNHEIDLTYILFDNESNKSTGGQNTYQKHLDYINIAKSSGLDVFTELIVTVEDFTKIIDKFDSKSGLKFLCVKCGVDEETPRPPLKIVKVNKL